MSKSQGNVVAPEKLIQQYGAEVLRLWVASSDYCNDVRLSDQIMKGLSEGYRKIRNTIRYALSSLYDFEPEKDAVAADKLLPLDTWAHAVELAGAAGEKAQALNVAQALGEDVKAEVLPAKGEKCPRCWTYSEKVASGAPVCEKCQEALS